MSASNTKILIKRSGVSGSAAPSSLLAGELAYSYNSNTAFIGSPTGDGVVKIGGQYYTNAIDTATDSATPNMIVKRDATGNASFNYISANIIGTITGNAESATKLINARNFSISGGDITASAVSFDGTGNVTLDASLNSIAGLSAGSYGSSTSIPVIDVAANGRVTSITTASISTEFTLDGDSGTTTVSGGDTLTVSGGNGITTSVSGDTLTVDVDNTVIRGNTAITLQTIDGSVQISGNLTVLGTQTTVNTQTLNIADPLIYLAANNYTSDVVDIGYVGNYFDGSAQRHAGVFRNAGNKEFYVFDNYDKEPTGNDIDVGDASFRAANLNVGWIKSAGIINNGINLDTHIQGIYNSANTNATDIIAVNNYATSAYGAANTNATNITAVNNYAASAYGAANTNATNITAVNNFAQSAYNAANNSVQTGDLAAVATSGAYSDLSGTPSLAAVATSGAYSDLSGTPTLASIATSGSASDIGTGTLAVDYGGTGLNTITQYGIVFGNGTSPAGVTSASGVADQTWSNQILTVTNAGVPVWTSALDGGTF